VKWTALKDMALLTALAPNLALNSLLTNAVVLTKMSARLVVLVYARLGNNVSISMAVTGVIVTKDTHDKVRNH